LDDIAMAMGGYAAEQMIFGDITTGPSNDLQVATNLARAMVTRWGMSDELGPVAFESDGGKTMFGAGVNDKEYSQEVSRKIDHEVSLIMNGAKEKAEHVLKEHKKALDAVAHKLLEVETLEQAAYEQIIIAHGILPKKLEGEKPTLEVVG
jgi:cell division protease FtsH